MYGVGGGGGLIFELTSETSGMDSSYVSVHSSSHILFALEAPKSKYLALKFRIWGVWRILADFFFGFWFFESVERKNDFFRSKLELTLNLGNF